MKVDVTFNKFIVRPFIPIIISTFIIIVSDHQCTDQHTSAHRIKSKERQRRCHGRSTSGGSWG
jgi:hypothetical protein